MTLEPTVQVFQTIATVQVVEAENGEPVVVVAAEGPPGSNAAIVGVEAVTLPPGSPATAENVGTELEAILRFGIPAGEQGEPGAVLVESVNGQTGAVVLDAADVGADTTGTAAAAVTAHEAAVNPHPGYATDAEASAAAAAAVAAHEAAGDPHPGYLTAAEGNAAYDAIGTAAAAVAAHVAAPDPHPSYLTQSEGDLRYAPLGAPGTTNLGYTAGTRILTSDTGSDVTLPLFTALDPGLVPASGGGTSAFLRADGTWAAPPSGAGATDLGYTASTRILTSSTGADVTLPLATGDDPGLMSAAQFTKLDGIAAGAEVNVQADWNAGSGDAQILNKPTLGTAAAAAATDFAPANKGVTGGDSHDHSGGDGAQIAYANLSGLPTLGGAAALNVGTTAGTVAAGNDARLSDARTPLSHTHGNISNGGAIGSTAGLPVKTGTSGVLEAGAFGTTAGTFAEGNDSRFHASVTLGASLTDVIGITGQALAAVDHGADRLLFWDDSEGKLSPLALGTNLSISGTTLNATGGGASLSDSTPLPLGTPSAGVAATASRSDHVHPQPLAAVLSMFSLPGI